MFVSVHSDICTATGFFDPRVLSSTCLKRRTMTLIDDIMESCSLSRLRKDATPARSIHCLSIVTFPGKMISANFALDQSFALGDISDTGQIFDIISLRSFETKIVQNSQSTSRISRDYLALPSAMHTYLCDSHRSRSCHAIFPNLPLPCLTS